MHVSDAALPCVVASRGIAGGSDADLVMAIIGGAAVCIDCIARQTGVPAPQVETMLVRIRATVRLSVTPSRCAVCLQEKIVFSLYRAPRQRARSSRRLVTSLDALWQFLQDHRGRMFCTQCLAAAIGATSRVDHAVMGAEGRGAQRVYGRCSACGRQRLVCGLAR